MSFSLPSFAQPPSAIAGGCGAGGCVVRVLSLPLTYESQGVGRTILSKVGCAEVEPRSCSMPLQGCLQGSQVLMVGDLLVSPFLPHLVVCGLSNHYTCGARHISMGCLDLLLVVGCSALHGAVHSLAPFFPLRLDSASTYNLLVIPHGSILPSPSPLPPSASPWVW